MSVKTMPDFRNDFFMVYPPPPLLQVVILMMYDVIENSYAFIIKKERSYTV